MNKLYRVLILLVFFGLGIPCVSAANVTSFVPQTVQMDTGASQEVQIVMDEVPAGLAGFNITVSVSDPEIAEITAVSFPTWNSIPENSSVPSSSIWIKSFDGYNKVVAGNTNVLLGTITITGKQAGTANLNIQPELISADGGSEINSDTITGKINVLDEESPVIKTSFAYITNSGDDTVSIIDTATDTVTATVKVGVDPFGVSSSPDGTKVYITNFNSGNISILDTATNTVIDTIPVGTYPYGVAVTPDGNKLYVSNYNSDTVSVIDIATKTIIATVPVGDASQGVAITPDGAKVYVVNCYTDDVSVIDTTTNTVTNTVKVGSFPNEIVITPDGKKAYVTVSSGGSGYISIIDIATDTIIGTVNHGSSGIAISPDGTRIYTTTSGSFGSSGDVSVIDTATNTTIATVFVGSTVPSGISITPDGKKVYVANWDGDNVSVINTTTNTITATVPVGDGPYSWGQFICTVSVSRPVINGSLVQAEGSLGVYLIENGTKHRFTSPEALKWNGYSFDNVTTITSETLQSYPDGEDISISQQIIDKYHEFGGEPIFGASAGEGEKDGDTDSAGTYCSYVNFENGSIEYFKNGDLVGKAYAVFNPFFNKWASMGYAKSVLGYPIDNMSNEQTSKFGTEFRYQNFANGTEKGALEYNISSGNVYEIHGAIFAKWGAIGYAQGDLGLPIMDQENRSGHWYCEFEGGNISWDASTGTYKASTSPALTTESLVRVEGSTDVYLIENGNKHRFTSEEALLWNGHSFDDINIVTNETLETYSDGENISISQAIIDKYNALGGASFFGASDGKGENDGKPDRDGNYCSYVNFEKGAIECFANGPHAGNAYAIVDQFYTKWASMGYGASVLGYPIGDMSEEKTSIKNTSYKYQLFTNGTQLGALEWNLNTNQVYEVHGAIFAKWAEIGFASSVLGLPTGDEQDIPNSKYGTVGRYGTFENGHIHWNKATGVSFVTSGDLNECYNKIQGTQSDLGFPIMSQVGTTDGHDYCEFEKGYIEWNVNSSKYEPNYGPNISQRIDAKLKAKPYFPPYLLDPYYMGRTSVLSVQLSDFILKTDLTGQYDKLYNDGIRYYGIRNCYLYNAKQSLKNNDITGAEKFLERADKMQMCSYNSFQAANDVFVGSTESAEILAQGVRTECELICNIGLGYAPYSSLSILGQSVKCKDAMFVTFACVDICKEWKINGIEEGAKQGVITVLTDYITSGIEYDVLGGKTLKHSVVEGSVDISKPAVRKQINVEIVDKLMTPGVQKALFDNGFHGTAIGAADAAAMYFTEDQLSKVIDLFIENTCRMIDVPIETVQSYSPVELRVYDSIGRVTGFVDGVVKNEIPNSIYQPELEKVFIYNATDTYRYETVGTANSTYGLKIVHYDNMTNQEVMLTDVPITINTKNIYNVDWENETQVNKSVITDTKPGYDIEEPIIESVVLFPANTTAGSKIDISASIKDNLAVAEVAAGDVQLMNVDDSWQGNITAPSSAGKYSLSIKANDAAGNTINTSVPYNVVRRQGRVDVAALPTASKVAAGKSTTLAIKVKNTQNVDDTFKVRINVNWLSAFYQADTSWFSWTEKTVNLRAKQEILIPIEVTVPAGTVNGIKFFKVSANSEKYSVQGSGTGSLVISRTSKDTNKQTGPKEPRFSR